MHKETVANVLPEAICQQKSKTLLEVRIENFQQAYQAGHVAKLQQPGCAFQVARLDLQECEWARITVLEATLLAKMTKPDGDFEGCEHLAWRFFTPKVDMKKLAGILTKNVVKPATQAVGLHCFKG